MRKVLLNLKNSGLKAWLPLLLALTPFLFVSVFAQDSGKQPDAEPELKVSEASTACLGCHDPAAESGPAMHIAALQKSPHKTFDCTDCHLSFTPDAPHTEKMLSEKVECSNCHSDAADALAASVHGKKDLTPGDHPTCISCHTVGTDPHEIIQPKLGTRTALVETCAKCHRDEAKMSRYKVDVEAVSSYEASFHGKALLRFDKQDTAVCTDCHTAHGVLASSDPKSSVSSQQLTKTCGQAGCHVGATMNFATSGFSHLHLKVKQEPILGATELFFKVLTFGTLGLLLLGIAFDMRVALFGPKKPAVARGVAVLVALGFLSLVTSILMAVFNNPIGFYTTGIAIFFGACAAVAHIATKKPKPVVTTERRFQRFTVSQRIQHITLMVSFTALVVTGMPIRYPKNDTLRALYMGLGGMDVMRLAHRVAAVILIAVWIYHTVELLVRWKRAGFSFDSWTMWPRKRDVTDLFATFRYHLGLSAQAPSYDRFQFREKFDYFAVYWGMPIMVFSGLILWYPVFYGGLLPQLGIPLAYIAHADESVLAFLTIVTWHFYNTHFKPDSFPMNPVFLTGMLSEKMMEEEHGDELARIHAAEAKVAEPESAGDVPEPAAEQDGEQDDEAKAAETQAEALDELKPDPDGPAKTE
ncbi:MAG: cytochrome b/b6 domain-containing protein [Fimbriimonas sp.]